MISSTLRNILSVGICTAVLLTPVQAEVLLVDAIAQNPPNSRNGLLRPQNGESMHQVETRFGVPTATAGPVGDPAITTWTYPAFSVYFEYDKVITAVVHRADN